MLYSIHEFVITTFNIVNIGKLLQLNIHYNTLCFYFFYLLETLPTFRL